MKKYTLSKGLKVFGWSEFETRILDWELFQEEIYMKNGTIKLRDGMTVVDIGSNIGLFSVSLLSSYSNISCYCFEPIPFICDIANSNLSMMTKESNSDKGNKGYIYCLGCASKTFEKDVTFKVNKNCTIQSGKDRVLFDPAKDSWRKLFHQIHLPVAFIRDAVRMSLIPGWLGMLLEICFRIPIIGLALTFFFFLTCILLNYFYVIDVPCKLVKTSLALKNVSSSTIDLVKLDVEGAELDVLMGIDDCDFDRIKQFVMECHNEHGNVAKIRDLLLQKGYSVTIEQEDLETHRIYDAYNLFAVKP